MAESWEYLQNKKYILGFVQKWSGIPPKLAIWKMMTDHWDRQTHFWFLGVLNPHAPLGRFFAK
jgi:hypothetical protein